MHSRNATIQVAATTVKITGKLKGSFTQFRERQLGS